MSGYRPSQIPTMLESKCSLMKTKVNILMGRNKQNLRGIIIVTLKSAHGNHNWISYSYQLYNAFGMVADILKCLINLMLGFLNLIQSRWSIVTIPDSNHWYGWIYFLKVSWANGLLLSKEILLPTPFSFSQLHPIPFSFCSQEPSSSTALALVFLRPFNKLTEHLAESCFCSFSWINLLRFTEWNQHTARTEKHNRKEHRAEGGEHRKQ